MSLLDDCHIAYVNLKSRIDRKVHMEAQLERIGLNAERFEAMNTDDYQWDMNKVGVMYNRTKGAVGCHYSQVAVMQKALSLNKHAFVLEDDCQFCEDWNERVAIMEDYLKDKVWHIIWWGGTYHANNPAWWHKPGHSEIPQCTCTLGIDAERTDSKYIVRTYGAFSTFCYIVHKDFIAELIRWLDEHVHFSIGIDFLMILLQPFIKSYSFVPGAVRQIDNMSNIGNGMTIFSGFKMLGEHWYQEKMVDFNYDNFKL